MKILDVIIIGGGVMGSATAYFLLKNNPTLKVAVFERDHSYRQSSTVLSDGNMRVQFNLRENILISQFGLEMLSVFSEEMRVRDKVPDIAFKQQGNLFLTDENGKDIALAGLNLQQELNCDVEWLSSEEVVERYDFLDGTTFVGGTSGKTDGTMDPQAVLMGYRNKAIDLGAEYIEADVQAILVQDQRVDGIRLTDGTIYHGKTVVNCAGAWTKILMESIGISLPVEPFMRHVFVLETTIRPKNNTMPLTVFPSGLYLIHENEKHFVCGKSLQSDPISYDFTFNRNVFMDHIWEELAYYVPAFGQLKVVSGWVGLYAINTLDHNAILGEWPEIKGLLLANGFSGHGFQQCHAVGRYLSELILGSELSLDLSIFSPQRILDGNPVFENPHKIV